MADITLTARDWFVFNSSPLLQVWYAAWEEGRLSDKGFVTRLREEVRQHPTTTDNGE